MAKIIGHGCLLSPSAIYAATDLGDPQNCPWIKVGNLYLSVTTTGNESWPSVIDYAQKMGANKFSILTGRHGDQFGQQVDLKSGEFSPGVAEKNHFKEDEIQAKKLADKGCDIEVIDVGNPPYNSVSRLKQLAQSKLGERSVIFAWCFSIYSMKEYPSTDPLMPHQELPVMVLKSKMRHAWETSVSALVTEGFEWVPGY